MFRWPRFFMKMLNISPHGNLCDPLFLVSPPTQCRGGLVRFANPLATCYFWLGVGDPLFLVSPPTMPGRAGEEAPGSAGREGGTRVSGGKAGGRGGTFGEKIWPSVWQGWQEGMNIYEENRRNISKSGDKNWRAGEKHFWRKLGDKILTQCHISQEHQLTSVSLNIKMFHWSVRESWEQRGSV